MFWLGTSTKCGRIKLINVIPPLLIIESTTTIQIYKLKLNLHRFTSTQKNLHRFTSTQKNLHRFTSTKKNLHRFTSTKKNLHRFTST